MRDAYADISKLGGDFAKVVAVCINSRQCETDGKGLMCHSFLHRRPPGSLYQWPDSWLRYPVRWRNCWHWLARLMQCGLGIAAGRKLPESSGSFKQPAQTPPASRAPQETLPEGVLLLDRVTRYYRLISQTALQAAGYRVLVAATGADSEEPGRPPCGRP
jgi:hypothetical protein